MSADDTTWLHLDYLYERLAGIGAWSATHSPGSAAPPAALPAPKAAAAHPPVVAAFPPTPAESGGNAVVARPATTPAVPARRPWEDRGHVLPGGQGRLVPDHTISDWWTYPAEPPTSRRAAVAGLVGAGLILAVILIGLWYGLSALIFIPTQ